MMNFKKIGLALIILFFVSSITYLAIAQSKIHRTVKACLKLNTEAQTTQLTLQQISAVTVMSVQEALVANAINEKLVELLKVYSAYDENGALELARFGKPNDGGYVSSVKALKLADVLLGYGIDNDSSFEEDFSEIYGKPSYGFDCGVDHIGKISYLLLLNNVSVVIDLCII